MAAKTEETVSGVSDVQKFPPLRKLRAFPAAHWSMHFTGNVKAD